MLRERIRELELTALAKLAALAALAAAAEEDAPEAHADDEPEAEQV